ncbi:unnamed protein product [Brugia timori]|uniref:Ovule protein n=1 Tax=Brugia timori TaxID=42155 RepID=A0A0R3QN94_9BILA|nr:unnamed protein product [Brugia timori]
MTTLNQCILFCSKPPEIEGKLISRIEFNKKQLFHQTSMKWLSKYEMNALLFLNNCKKGTICFPWKMLKMYHTFAYIIILGWKLLHMPT